MITPVALFAFSVFNFLFFSFTRLVVPFKNVCLMQRDKTKDWYKGYGFNIVGCKIFTQNYIIIFLRCLATEQFSKK